MYQANSSSYDDGGYKSDGEAYQVCYNNHHHNHNSTRVRHHTGGASATSSHPPNHSHQRPIRSLSGQMIHEPNTHQSSGRNGYLSDGEGYIIQNQRVSRSGKYGSQASSPRSDRQLMHHPDDSEEESDDDDDEEDEEEEEDLEDNIEAEIHLNDMKEEKPGTTIVTTQSNAGPSQADLIVSYSAFQAEALAAGKNNLPGNSSRRVQSIPAYLGKEQLQFTMHAVTTTETATVRRSNSNNENSRVNQTQQPTSQSQVSQQPSENGQRSSRRSSRSNSRQGDSVDSGTGTGRQVRGGGASSSQSDHRSDGGYKSDGWYQQRSQPPQPSTKRPDGYRSEGSTESPKHHEVQHMTMNDGRGGTRSAGCRRNHHQGLPVGSQAPTHHMRTNKHMPPPMPPTGGHFQVPQNSRSLQSFSRQESTGSFYSSHSAPGCGRHPHLHSHAGHHSLAGSSSAAQVQPRQQQNLESCSTQSSSSSASAGPPDYNACAVGGSNPPSYEQAKRRGGNAPPEVPPKVPPHGNSKKKSGLVRGNSSSQRHHHFSMPVSKSSSSRGAGSNELYYMGEFYG